MSVRIKALAIAGALAISGPALAQTASPAASAATAAVAIKGNETLKSADGRRIGRVDHVVKGQGGSVVAVSLAFRSRFVSIPASTLTAAGEGELVTSLSYGDIKNLP
jgi:cytochrome oxidase Cu insertion factor (SCO1/SenC/PrrC family)